MSPAYPTDVTTPTTGEMPMDDRTTIRLALDALWSIRRLCTTDRRHSFEAIDLLSRYLAASVATPADEQLVDLRQEIEMAVAYLNLLQITRDQETVWNVTSQDQSFPVPSRALQAILQEVTHHDAWLEGGGSIDLIVSPGLNVCSVQVRARSRKPFASDAISVREFFETPPPRVNFARSRARLLCGGDVLVRANSPYEVFFELTVSRASTNDLPSHAGGSLKGADLQASTTNTPEVVQGEATIRIAAVDGSPIALEALVHSLRDALPKAVVDGYRTAADALQEMKVHRYDAVFTDVEMPDLDGATYAQELQRTAPPRTNIVFVTGHHSFMEQALNMHCSGYVIKPIDVEKVRHELDNLRFPIDGLRQGLFVRCFGRFEVYWDGVPLRFKRHKSRELLAYLVCHRGAMCSVHEVESVLWERGGATSHQSHLRHLVAELSNALEKVGAKGVLLRSRGVLGVDPRLFSCDYYDYLDAGAKPPTPRFFMEQYSWAEQFKAALSPDAQG